MLLRQREVQAPFHEVAVPFLRRSSPQDEDITISAPLSWFNSATESGSKSPSLPFVLLYQASWLRTPSISRNTIRLIFFQVEMFAGGAVSKRDMPIHETASHYVRLLPGFLRHVRQVLTLAARLRFPIHAF